MKISKYQFCVKVFLFFLIPFSLFLKIAFAQACLGRTFSDPVDTYSQNCPIDNNTGNGICDPSSNSQTILCQWLDTNHTYCGGCYFAGNNCTSVPGGCFIEPNPNDCKFPGAYPQANYSNPYTGPVTGLSNGVNITNGCTLTNPDCTNGTINCTGWGSCNGEDTNTCNNNGSQNRTCTHNTLSDGSTSCNQVQFSQSQACGWNNCSANYSPSGAVGSSSCSCTTTVTAHVFEDTNNNGNQDAGEPNLQGVSTNDNGVFVTTNASGNAGHSGKTSGTNVSIEADITSPFNGVYYTKAAIVHNVTLTNSNGNTTLNYAFAPAFSISGNVYVDYNHNGSQDNGVDTGFTNSVQVSDGTHTVSTDGSGNFTFPHEDASGTYTISIVNSSMPAGYQAQIGSTQVTVNGADVNGVLLSVTPLFTISGMVYNDNGQNGFYDTPGDTPYTDGTSKFTLSGGPTSLPESDSNTGTFSFASIESGTYTISYTSLPTGYRLTYPLSGNPPSLQVTVGTPGKSSAAYECDTKGVHNAVCDGAGSISGVDFGITNESSIIQTTCGDTRFDGGYSQVIPSSASCGGTSGPYAIVQNPALCPTSPGILFSGSTDPNYGGAGGSASTSKYVVGDTSFPEKFTARIPNTVSSSYSFVMTTINNLSAPPTPLTSICPTLTCDLSQINPGVYTTKKGDGNVTFYVSNPTFTLNSGSYTFVIGDDITFTSKVLLQSGQAASFISGGNIHVTGNVAQGNAGEVGETTWTSTAADLDGFYSADGSFSVDRIDNSAPVCNNDGSPIDKKLNMVGTVITNAGGAGGSLVNNRNGCVESLSCPVVSVQQDPLQILHAPGPLKPPYTFWQELNP